MITPASRKPSARWTGASTSSVRSRRSERSTRRCAPRATRSAAWRNTSLAERAAILTRFCDEFEKRGAKIAEELTWQMGRPARYAPNEVRGTLERARHMIAIAPQALGDLDAGPKDELHALRAARAAGRGVHRRRLELPVPHRGEQRGAGAHGRQRRDPQAFRADAARARSDSPNVSTPRDCPRACSRCVHASHEDTDRIIRDPRVDFVAFTGSVAGGHAVQRAAASRFIGVGLELGGCDPVYVRHDANLDARHREHRRRRVFQFRAVLLRLAAHLRAPRRSTRSSSKASSISRASTSLGDPTRRGHHARARWCAPRRPTACARRSRRRSRPAPRARSPKSAFAKSERGTPYLAPQVLLNVDHRMPVMREEIFGPVAGIMKVSSDDEAVDLMNDSDFGLTAAIWTEDADAALALGQRVQHRHLVHEPLRLPGSRAGLGGREGFGPRLYAVGGRLRTPHAAEVIPHED